MFTVLLKAVLSGVKLCFFVWYFGLFRFYHLLKMHRTIKFALLFNFNYFVFVRLSHSHVSVTFWVEILLYILHKNSLILEDKVMRFWLGV